MTATPHHHEVLERLHADLADLTGLALSPLGDDDLAALLDACTQFNDRLAHATARVVVAADQRQLGGQDGSRHTAHWWARRSKLTRGEAARTLDFGWALTSDLYAPLADMLTEGAIRLDQARVVVQTIDDLPDDLDDAVRDKARDHMLDLSRRHDARELRILGKKILEVIDPDRFEEEEGKRLEREAQRANAAARLTLTNDGKGRVWGRFNIPALQGELLRNQLLALADPRRDEAEDSSDEGGEVEAASANGSPDPTAAPRRRRGALITPERMGHALMELIEAIPHDVLPRHAGSSVALNVHIDIKQLRKELGVATLEDGLQVAGSEIRRLACQSHILPAILDGASEVLDLGKIRRLFSTAQFRALAVRDKGCTAEGCGMTSRVCHAHHDIPWSEGGPTDLANGRLLCPHHHRLIHDPRYETRPLAGGRISFHRRP